MRYIFIFSSLFTSFIFSFDNWDWENIDYRKISFPKNFLWGTATAEYQNSGAETCKNNNWAEWEQSVDSKGNPRIKDGQISKKSTDHWNLYKEDIKLMKELGVNSYRFSVEWSLIEPEEGVFDPKAIEHYQEVIASLLEANITPMITLHHFTNPLWFQKIGSFEKEENIKYFVRFCSYVFDKLSSKVNLWCTINEPGIYAFMGYILGYFPPGYSSFQIASEVLQNLLKAHCQVYRTLKTMPNGEKAQIGLVHNLLKMEPYNSWNFIVSIPCSYLSYMTTDCITHFLKTGKYVFYIPFAAYSCFEDDMETPLLDFIGLNYYSHPLLGLQLSLYEPMYSCCYSNEVMSDMQFRLYPEGIYRAVQEISEIGVPIYITENGIPDNSGKHIATFINRYLYALSCAITDGYDVRGYFYWTLTNNFEWNEGYRIKWGLYDVDFDTQKRTLKEGAKAYQNIIKSSKN